MDGSTRLSATDSSRQSCPTRPLPLILWVCVYYGRKLDNGVGVGPACPIARFHCGPELRRDVELITRWHDVAPLRLVALVSWVSEVSSFRRLLSLAFETRQRGTVDPYGARRLPWKWFVEPLLALGRHNDPVTLNLAQRLCSVFINHVSFASLSCCRCSTSQEFQVGRLERGIVVQELAILSQSRLVFWWKNDPAMANEDLRLQWPLSRNWRVNQDFLN